MKYYTTFIFLFIISLCKGQDCNAPVITRKLPEIIASYKVYKYEPNEKDSSLILSVHYDSINKNLTKKYFDHFNVGEGNQSEPDIKTDIYKVHNSDSIEFVRDEKEKVYDYYACHCRYHYKNGQIIYIENYQESKLVFTNYFTYDKSNRLTQTRAIKPDKMLYSTVDYEYLTDGYKQTFKYYYMEKGKLLQEDIWYIWKYVIKNGKIVGTTYSNNKTDFEKEEILYDSIGRLIQRNINEYEDGTYIYKYFY